MKKIFSFFLQSLMLVALALTGASCDRVIYDGEVDCPPGYVKISVQSSPAGSGFSKVQEDANTANAIDTDEEQYVHILVAENGSYTLSADPADDYDFVGWHDDLDDKYIGDATEPVIEGIAATASKQYTAVFKKKNAPDAPAEPQPVRISVKSSPDGGGDSTVYENDNNTETTNGSLYVHIFVLQDNTYSLIAQPADSLGYEFVGWYNETEHKYIGDKEDLVIEDIVATAAMQYIAVFKQTGEPETPAEPQPVRISVMSSPAGSGFSQVYENDNNSIETDGDMYVSIFVLENDTYSLIATEKEGYLFKHWYDETNHKYIGFDDEGKPKAVIEDLVATAPAQYIAVFEELPDPVIPDEPQPVRISVMSSPAGGGTSKVQEDADTANHIETDGEMFVSIEVLQNNTYSLIAEKNDGYEFIGWYDNTHDSFIGTGADGTPQAVIENLVATESTQYIAVFRKLPDPVTPDEPQPVRISVMSRPAGSGESMVFENDTNFNRTYEDMFVSIDVLENNTYSLSAKENDGYKFIRWFDQTDGKYLEEGVAEFPDLVATAPKQYIAIFEKLPDPVIPDEPQSVRISVRSLPAGSGTSKVQEDADTANHIETDGSLFVSIDMLENGTYSLSAEANDGYKFVGWYDETDGNYLEAEVAEFPDLVATASKQYTALFEQLPAVEPTPEVSYYVEFVYDKNMKFADAFYSQVNSVDLFVFNKAGQFMKKYSATKEADGLNKRGYKMDVSDLEPGEYEFIVWGGLNGNANFKVPETIATREDLTCTLVNNPSSKNLESLFHGITVGTLPENESKTVTVYLTKNTNNINLSLTQLGTAEMGQFTVKMVDNNGIMNYNNEVSGTDVTYTPWYETDGHEDLLGSNSNAINYMRAEISTARLMATHNPTIVITDNDNNGEVVFSIPIVKWALAFRSHNYSEMLPQDYLDREDEYNVVLYLEKNDEGGWTAVQVVINNWRVKDNGTANF